MNKLALLIGLVLIGLYVLSPVDLMPLNPLDDLAVSFVGLTLILKSFGMEDKAPIRK